MSIYPYSFLNIESHFQYKFSWLAKFGLTSDEREDAAEVIQNDSQPAVKVCRQDVPPSLGAEYEKMRKGQGKRSRKETGNNPEDEDPEEGGSSTSGPPPAKKKN